MIETTPEINVLIAVCKYLVEDRWRVERVSPPKGQAARVMNRETLSRELRRIGLDPGEVKIGADGEDVRAIRDGIVWKIECKGFGNGSRSTISNDFGRLVASVVSHYAKGNELKLGMALPLEYGDFIRDGIPEDFREAINLSMLLYVTDSGDIVEFEPGSTVEFPEDHDFMITRKKKFRARKPGPLSGSAATSGKQLQR